MRILITGNVIGLQLDGQGCALVDDAEAQRLIDLRVAVPALMESADNNTDESADENVGESTDENAGESTGESIVGPADETAGESTGDANADPITDPVTAEAPPAAQPPTAQPPAAQPPAAETNRRNKRK